ncbi:TonB-dependent receptor [Wenyingzhuangia aestuarii]|uniref:TonB-dependent receptor n=1 Tax=Wenyingzhuangia aestuarii TaxID=1647582 RepID=UPI0014397C4A|nr:TonB-dependent receptor [Wenyingzhuangia aestuarii]NJB82667.1 iron complex outermembrane receptor protein [Wenyingzhuangia aestuarii]
MKKLLLLSIILLATVNIYAQKGNIKGKISSKEGVILAYANISIKGTNYKAFSNQSGAYVINNIDTGDYTLLVKFIGYKPVSKKIKIQPNQTTITNILLTENQEKLKEVVINGHKNIYTTKTPSESLRLKTPLIKIPQNIQIVNKELISDQASFTMMDGITRNVSGAQMIEHWGSFSRINMRGFRIAPMRNGMNLTTSWGPLAEDMSIVERVEFVKGPAAYMLASGEPGGFYNVVTKKPSSNRVAEVNFAAGSFNTFRGAIDYGNTLVDGKLQYRVNFMKSTQGSHRDFEKTDRTAFAPSLKYLFTDNTSLSAEYIYQKVKMPYGGAYVFGPASAGFASLDRDFTAIEEDFQETDMKESQFFTNFTHKFNNNWELQAQYSNLNYKQEGMSPWAVWGSVKENGDLTRYVSSADALIVVDATQLFVNGSFNTGNISHKILAGVDYNNKISWHDWSQSAVIDVTPFNIYNPVYGNAVFPDFDRSKSIKERDGLVKYTALTKGYYLQDEIGFFQDRLRLSLAGRYTDADITQGATENKGSLFTPRVGLSYDILSDFTVYGLYDQAFKPQTGASKTNETFDAEIATDIEGGLKKTWFNGKLNTSLTVFQITKDNILVTDPTDANFSIQLGQVQSKGLEFDLQGQITPELNVVFNYANTNVEITKDSDPLKVGTKVAGHSKHITNGWFNYNFNAATKLKGFGLSLGYQYLVDRSSWAWATDGEDSILPDYFRLDGGISWKNDKVNVRLNVNNLLNKYLYSGAGYGDYLYWQTEPGTNAKLSIAYKF